MFQLSNFEYQFIGALFLGLIWQVLYPLIKHLSVFAGCLFLSLQVLVILKFDLASYQSLLIIMGLLAIYSFYCNTNTKLAKSATLFSLIAYFTIWFFLKYSHTFVNYFLFSLKNVLHYDIALLSDKSDHFYDSISLYPIVGLSFMGFKLIHFILDKKHGQISKEKPLEVLAWLFFFPTIISGPIQRFQDWQKHRQSPTLSLKQNITSGLKRVIEGLFLKFVLADQLRELTIISLTPEQLTHVELLPFLIFCLLYPLYLYWDFAGYSSLAIGFGHFWGMPLPENFNFPLSARNLSEFWNKWHITLSLWLKEYLYYPLAVAIKRKPSLRKYPNLIVWLPPLFTFLIAGFWHGAQIGYILFGLCHGLGLGWIAFLDKNLSPKNQIVKYWRTSRVSHICAVILNYLFLSFSLGLFALSNKHIKVLFERIHVFY